MRDPKNPGWPERGERTEHEDVAEEWAWAYLRHFQRQKHRRQKGIPDPLPNLGEAGERWLRHRERTVEPTTVASSQTALNHLYRAFGRSVNLRHLTTDKLQAWFSEMLDAQYKVSTLDNYRAYLSGFFRFYGREGVLEGVELPNTGEFDPKAWSDDELQTLRRGSGDVPDHRRLLVEAGICTGARRNELAALRWSDFRPANHTVRIERQVRSQGTGVKALKGKSARTALVLPSWWEHHEPKGEYVLGGDGPVGEQTVQRMMNEVLDAAGLNELGVGVHSLRHTYSRLFLEGGGSLEQLQRFLGHSSITTTARSYGHFGDEAAVRLAREEFYPHD